MRPWEEPCYIVCVVQLWGGKYLDGFQFYYRHCRTGDVVAADAETDQRRTKKPTASTTGGFVEPLPDVDVASASTRTTTNTTRIIECVLEPGEYIINVRGREGSWTDAIELVLNSGRSFRMGGDGGLPFDRAVEHSHEVRGLSALVYGDVERVQPKTLPRLDMETISLLRFNGETEFNSIKMLESECAGLRTVYLALAAKMEAAYRRGLLCTAAVVTGFYEVSLETVRIFHKCNNMLKLVFGSTVRRKELLETASKRTQELLLQVDSFLNRDVAMLIATKTSAAWDHYKVRAVIDFAMETQHCTLLAALLTAHARTLSPVFQELGHLLLEQLIECGELKLVQELVQVHASIVASTIDQVLTLLAHQSPSPVEASVRFAQLPVLEWLVTKGQQNPFDCENDHQSTVLTLVDQVQDPVIRERMQSLLSLVQRRDEFERDAIALAYSDRKTLTLESFVGMVPKITSVDDLAVLHTMAKPVLSEDDFKVLLLRTCDQLMAIGMPKTAPGGPRRGFAKAMAHYQQPKQ